MSQRRALELAMKIVDADATAQDSSAAPVAHIISGDDDTQASPGLRPDVLAAPEQQRARAAVRAALFGDGREAPTIGRYRVLSRIGEGAMGVVYAAFDERLDRKVALKLLRGAWVGSPEGRERALREARALARLSHPHVVHVYEVGETVDEVFVAMEFLHGPTLRDWLEEAERPWQDIVAVFRQAAEGLAAAHRHGVVHRDFKPVNAIFGGDGRVRVVDFGLAHFADASGPEQPPTPALPLHDHGLTQSGAVLGTPAYMAPEQFAGRRGDARSDQYALCVALYEALYRQRPFAGDTLAERWKSAAAGALRPARGDAPAWLFRAIARGLQPDPGARWPSMDALLSALAPPRRAGLRLAAAAAGLSVSMFAGAAYVSTLSRPPVEPQDDVARQALAVAAEATDAARLTEARSQLAGDPVAALATLAGLDSDDPDTWRRARTLASLAEARGLPAQLLQAGAAPLAELQPFGDGALLARDDLGAVWRWDLATGRSQQLLPPGSAEQLVTARDGAAWAAIGRDRARVFQGDQSQDLDLARLDPRLPYHWSFAADGRILAAEPSLLIPGGSHELLLLWDLTTPGSAPRPIATTGPGTGQTVVLSDDLSLIVVSEPGELRLIRPDREDRIQYDGRALTLTADRRFLVAQPRESADALDVFDLEQGGTRRVEATGAVALGGADVLFTGPAGKKKRKTMLHRESLATGEVAWRTALPQTTGGVLVDAAGGRFAAALPQPGEWAIGALDDGRLASFVALRGDTPPQWAGDNTLIQRVGAAVRVYRPDAAPLQIRQDGHGCDMSQAGRFAVIVPSRPDTDEFTRVELATGERVNFRCPTAPKPRELGGRTYYSLTSAVDDAGQVLLAAAGWSCWYDDVHGAREGDAPAARPDVVALPRGGFLVIAETAVQRWRAHGAMTHAWTLPGASHGLVVAPAGELAATRIDGVAHLLNLETGSLRRLGDHPIPDLQDQVAGALAWSPDGARLAVLDKRGGALRLGLWDVAGEQPREQVHHDLSDSPGVVTNELAFTPSGAAVAYTDREASLARLDLATGARRQLALPESLFGLHMLDETQALAVDTRGVPLLAEFASGDAAALAPDPDRGFSSNPTIRRGEDGALWICDALGAGALTRLPAPPPAEPAAVRAWIRGHARLP